MKPLQIRFLAPLSLWLTSLVHAHPGHDGHELVWEYSGGHTHLAGLLWVALAALVITAAYRYVKKKA